MSTYVPIQAITLSSAAASVTFTGIPQTYTDLVLVANGSTSTATNNILFRFNGDTGSNYSRTRVLGNGSSASSERQSNVTSMAIGDWGTDRCVVIANIQNYSNTTTNKTVLSRSSSEGFVSAYVGLWRNTSAISSITFFKASADFTSGTTFTLYGVGSGSPKAFGGDEVRTDGTYWYHIFRSSGRFEPVQDLSCDYLVVAGGGGGTYGGGGAGGMRCTVTGTGGSGALESPITLSANSINAVTVGAGGPAGTNTAIGSATNGSNSVFASITSTGGGRGGIFGSTTAENGQAGGSGGGGGNANTGGTPGTGGAASPSGQGFAGSAGTALTTNGVAGGGGGASAAATVGTNSSNGGKGGDGRATSISGSSVTYAGGGSGGGSVATTGGTGGGGSGGAASSPGTAATVNTGGGGGGGGNALAGVAGGAGGSGIVIVRYAV